MITVKKQNLHLNHRVQFLSIRYVWNKSLGNLTLFMNNKYHQKTIIVFFLIIVTKCSVYCFAHTILCKHHYIFICKESKLSRVSLINSDVS